MEGKRTSFNDTKTSFNFGRKKNLYKVNACLKQENPFQDFYINLEWDDEKRKKKKKRVKTEIYLFSVEKCFFEEEEGRHKTATKWKKKLDAKRIEIMIFTICGIIKMFLKIYF